MWEMFTDDGRIVEPELDVLVGCCDDPAHGKGLLIDAANQYTNEQGNWVQVGWDRSLMPICAIEKTKILGMDNKDGPEDDEALLTKLVDQIFHEASEARKEKVWSKANRNLALDKIIWLVTIPSVVVLLGFAMILIKKG